jgi:hypothetical protein
MYVNTPPQEAGVVDVSVANPGGQLVSAREGFSYRLPQSFDFNGTWSGFGDAGQDILLGFTIRAACPSRHRSHCKRLSPTPRCGKVLRA